jgi:thiamine-monophosphate kinase
LPIVIQNPKSLWDFLQVNLNKLTVAAQPESVRLRRWPYHIFAICALPCGTIYAANTMKRVDHGIGELALIEQIRLASGRAKGPVRLGIGDDCAILRVPAGCEMLVTTDFTLEGRHFRRDWHMPESVGHRCLARGLSDLAAMGADPVAAFLSLALPGEMLGTAKGRSWLRRFFAGLRGLGDRYGVTLAGGDTAESVGGRVLADIVLVGSAPMGKALRRSGGRVGDVLYCTGALGGAAAELAGMSGGLRTKRVSGKSREDHPQMFPEPRLAVGRALRRRGLATACIDMSDGLSTDLTHLCRESGVHAEVQWAALPVHALAARLKDGELQRAVLHGGEDYELLFAAPESVAMPRKIAGVAITRIGRLTRRRTEEPVVTLVSKSGERQPLKPGGWEHFSGAAKNL